MQEGMAKAGFIQEMGEELWCVAGFTYSQQLAKAANQYKVQKSFEEMVPLPYWHHFKVFLEKESEWLFNNRNIK